MEQNDTTDENDVVIGTELLELSELSVSNESLQEVTMPFLSLTKKAPAIIKKEVVPPPKKNLEPSLSATGVIDLSFPENPEPEFEGIKDFPQSYYTLSGKERLLLLFAENFRRQFHVNYPKRKPLVLAVKNECNVQKFVCTSIRPTPFLFPDLIGSLDECAKFVADFVIYEPLEDPVAMIPRLISPDTLLRRRKGNCFEMATLLCSMLIGAGFAAMVVSGYATKDTTRNDQRLVECPFIPKDKKNNHEKSDASKENKYALRGPPDLRSRFMMDLEDQALKKQIVKLLEKEKTEQALIESMESQTDDNFSNRRIHSWVAVIENAPWSYKPKQVEKNEDGDEITPVPQAFFIEPSTGFQHEANSRKYIRIDSIWNQYNYFVNRQEGSIADMQWDLSNSEDWECFLPNEPPELFPDKPTTIEIPEQAPDEEELSNKYLDMLPSWVQRLHIGEQDFEQRYPSQEKAVYYRKALYQQFSPYFNTDGLIARLTQFGDMNYKKSSIKWEWYEHREDFLYMIKTNFGNKVIEESFYKGRPDCLRFYKHSSIPIRPKFFYFYYLSRLDSLSFLELFKDKIILHFEKREDLCYYLEFQTQAKDFDSMDAKLLVQIIEKCERNLKIPSNKDIAVHQFQLPENKILLKYHYAKDAITASTREFIKPPKADYGQDIIFDPNSTSGYNANPLDPLPKQVELYLLLLDELNREERLIKAFDKRYEEITTFLSDRRTEMLSPKLKFSIFDPLRNNSARKVRLEKYEEYIKQQELALIQDADFLAPYLVTYGSKVPAYDESWAIYNSCLSDVKSRYQRIFNAISRRFEDLTTEASAMKKFMMKFQTQFDKKNYIRLIKESKDIEINRRMVQARLVLVHTEGEKKYEKIKESLLLDKRLNLNNPTVVVDIDSVDPVVTVEQKNHEE